MAVNRISRAFKDIDILFEPHPVTKDLPVLTNERAINRSLRNLVETIPTERFFNSRLGSDVRSSLFEQNDVRVAVTIQDQIQNVINLFEPRVSDVSVEAVSFFDDNAFEVTIIYTIVGQSVPSVPYTFVLELTR